jgi:hypothetical protein
MPAGLVDSHELPARTLEALPVTVEVALPGTTILNPVCVVHVVAIEVRRLHELVLRTVLATELPARVPGKHLGLQIILGFHVGLALYILCLRAIGNWLLNLELHNSIVDGHWVPEPCIYSKWHVVLLSSVMPRLNVSMYVILGIHGIHLIFASFVLVWIVKLPFDLGPLALEPKVNSDVQLPILVHRTW